jgi:hypothetical protein
MDIYDRMRLYLLLIILLISTLRGVPEVGVVCPYCGESASGLAAFERHMEWHCMSRFVVTVSFWRYGSHMESSVTIDGLWAPLLEQVMAKFKTSEAWWGRQPEEGVRVFLGDDSRFVLTELDARASLTGIHAQGGVHVVGGTVQPLAGRMRLHIFDGSDDCRAKECAGSVFMHKSSNAWPGWPGSTWLFLPLLHLLRDSSAVWGS